MGYISKQWLKGGAQRNRSHIPVPVVISVTKGSYLDCKVTLTTTWLNNLGEEYKSVDLTKEEVEQALPYFLCESDLADLTSGDPKRVAIVAALSKLSDTEFSGLVSDIRAAQAVPEPQSGFNVAGFAAALGLPNTLLLKQFQAAGIGKMEESDSITEQDKTQLLEYLRQANNADSLAKGVCNMKTVPAANTTDAQERQLMMDAVVMGKRARVQIMLEARQGERKLIFDELRKLDMDIAIIEQELARE